MLAIRHFIFTCVSPCLFYLENGVVPIFVFKDINFISFIWNLSTASHFPHLFRTCYTYLTSIIWYHKVSLVGVYLLAHLITLKNRTNFLHAFQLGNSDCGVFRLGPTLSRPICLMHDQILTYVRSITSCVARPCQARLAALLINALWSVDSYITIRLVHLVIGIFDADPVPF